MLSCLIALAFTHIQAKGLAAITTPQVAEAVGWLPVDSECVNVVAEAGKTLGPEGAEFLGDSVVGLAEIGMLPGKASMPLPASYDFIVQGLRNVRAPKKTYGLFLYDGCNIVGLQPAEETRLKALAIKDGRHAVVDGRDIYVFQQKANDDVWNFYITFDANLMFSATDKTYLAQVLKRRKDRLPSGKGEQPQAASGQGSDSAVPDSLEQLQYIEPGAPFWAVRKFPPVGGKLSSGVTVTKTFPRGFSVWLSKDRKTVNLIQVMNAGGMDVAKHLWDGYLNEEGEHQADFKAIDSRTTQTIIDAKAPRTAMFVLLGLFGHPIIE